MPAQPNSWLSFNSMLINNGDFGMLFLRKRALFLENSHFDASELRVRYPGLQFDVVYSHSILSHASDAQLPQYLANVRAMLRPGGLSLSSIRFSDVHGVPVPASHSTECTYSAGRSAFWTNSHSAMLLSLLRLPFRGVSGELILRPDGGPRSGPLRGHGLQVDQGDS
jgi:hypothetical protein